MFMLNTSLNPANTIRTVTHNLINGITLNFLGSIVGAAVSLYAGKKASDSAAGASARATNLEQQKLDFAKSQYDDYKAQYGGLEEDLVASIDEFATRDNLSRYMSEGVTDVRGAFKGARERGAREQTRYGIDPGDPRFQQQQTQMDLGEAKADIGARTEARRRDEEQEDKLFAKRIAAGSFGKGLPGASTALSSALGESASSASAEAGRYAQQAGQGYGMAGRYIGKAIDSYGGGETAPAWAGSETPDYGSGTMTDEYGDFSSGDLGW